MEISFPEAVLQRPKMYTTNGSYLEVVAFLQGYYAGLSKAKPDHTPVILWSSFVEWLSDKMGSEQTDVFAVLEKKDGGKQSAIGSLRSYVICFREEKSIEVWR